MNDRKNETRYLSKRLTDSLDMAAAAAGPCAQIAHLTLARLYGEAIDALIARPCIQTFHSLFSAADLERASSSHLVGANEAKPMILALAADERQLASSLLG
jgi:hypothetical protein